MQESIDKAVLWATKRSRPYWTDLRSVSNTPAVRAVILIPFIGYWIILNDQIVSSIADLTRFIVTIDKDRPGAPWRLFATYFGLCWIAVGSLAYQVCCPRVVKDYTDSTAYARAFTLDVSGAEMDRVANSLSQEPTAQKRGERHSAHYESARSVGFHNSISHQDQLQLRHDYWRNLLQEDFDLRNSRCYPGRIFVTGCYAIGFVVLMFPTLDVFGRVVKVLWRAVW